MDSSSDIAIQKFERFKNQFEQSLNLVGDAADSFQILIKKHGFSLEEKLHAKSMTRVKRDVLELLMKIFETFRDDLKVCHGQIVEEFEERVKKSIEKVDKIF